jgi:hypothetical protein
LLSATPQFLVSDGRVLDNGLDRPATFNVTSSISQTYRVAATVGVMSNPQNFLSGSVSVTIEASRTTQVGVSVTTEVPPHSRVIAEYGVEAYAVSYAIEAWQSLNMNGTCEEWGYYPQSTQAPTNIEGWRLRAG